MPAPTVETGYIYSRSSLDFPMRRRGSYGSPFLRFSPDGHRRRHEVTCAFRERVSTKEKRMQLMDKLISVQLDWCDWHIAMVPLSELSDLHWHQPSRAPQALLHGYVACSSIVSGTIPHDCQSQPAPHRLRVCLLKKHILPAVYSDLSRRANERLLGGTNPSLLTFASGRHAPEC